MNPVEIRKSIRQSRRNIDDATRTDWSRRICERVVAVPKFQSSQKIGGFLAFDGEADPLAAMQVAVGNGQRVFVPIIVGKNKPLLFAPWSPKAKMRSNRFGIAEPDVPATELISATELDFVITPLVAFDERCNRIGVGGGYYDRSFAFTKKSSESSERVTLVGFAFELQKVESIQTNHWDVRLNRIVTEAKEYQRSE